MKYFKFYLLSFGIIAIDQAVKLAVVYHMDYGGYHEILIFGDWFKLHFTENEGMAFGLKMNWIYGKLTLTLFRWVAMIGIVYYLFLLIKRNANQGFIWCIVLILAGAIGNVIDSTFYGIFLDNAPNMKNPPPFYPLFHGKVVDMFYFDIWQGTIAEWIPLMGGKYYSFWPIFNVADASIFIGVSIIMIFQKRFFSNKETEKTEVSKA